MDAEDASATVAAAIMKQIEDMGGKVFFEKALTASDASGSGRVVVPKAIAEQYFPSLDVQNGLPVTATDTKGRVYNFRWRYWINNQSRMYLLEGAGELHHAYMMNVGDVMVFAQREDGSLVVAGRPATRADVVKRAPVKRASAAPGGSGAQGARQRDPSSRKDAAAKAAAGGDAAAKKRKVSLGTGPRALPSAPRSTEPPVDGVFRAVSSAGVVDTEASVAMTKTGRWVVTLNLAGELYQAFFDTQDDAHEAFNAAGGILSPGQPATTIAA